MTFSMPVLFHTSRPARDQEVLHLNRVLIFLLQTCHLDFTMVDRLHDGMGCELSRGDAGGGVL
jgi:hypothetical protein